MSKEKMGFDEEIENEEGVTEAAPESDKVVDFEKPKRKPFAYWDVGGEQYRMKLDTATICKLEEKFRGNLIELLTGNSLPQLAIMLTVAQAAMKKWNHGIRYDRVQRLFDQYCDEGGSQLSFFTNVIMDVMCVSGFFTPTQAAEIQENMKEMTEEA